MKMTAESARNESMAFSPAMKLYLRNIAKLSSPWCRQLPLFRRLRKSPGNLALRNRLVEANLRLVVSAVSSRNFHNCGMESEDLVQYGNLGLQKAVERFNPARGTRFSTYAMPWILKYIRKGITDSSRLIRLPEHVVANVRKLNQVALALEMELDRTPSAEEIAGRIGWNAEKVRELQLLSLAPRSLQEIISSDNENHSLEDICRDVSNPSPDGAADANLSLDVLDAHVNSLPARERTIIIHSFGLRRQSVLSTEQLAQALSLSGERIRQLRRKALLSLRSAFAPCA